MTGKNTGQSAQVLIFNKILSSINLPIIDKNGCISQEIAAIPEFNSPWRTNTGSTLISYRKLRSRNHITIQPTSDSNSDLLILPVNGINLTGINSPVLIFDSYEDN